jgi:FkbM family methyltransferase
MNIINSIFYRSKYFLENVESKRILNYLGYKGKSKFDLDLINSIATIKSTNTNFNVLLDIGAYQGKFSELFYAIMPVKRIICIEPNEKQNSIINQNNKNNPIKILNCALSEKEEELNYFEHEDASMNSIVPSSPEILRENFPFDNPNNISSKQIRTKTLDLAIAPVITEDSSLFLKIDTQGNEINILKGGLQVLKQTNGILIEHIFTSPYESDYSFDDMISFLYENGFKCVGPVSISRRPNFKISAVDFLFLRTNPI